VRINGAPTNVTDLLLIYVRNIEQINRERRLTKTTSRIIYFPPVVPIPMADLNES